MDTSKQCCYACVEAIIDFRLNPTSTSILYMYKVFEHLPSGVRPRRVRPVRWQIKDFQTTEPRTFDSGFSGKVNDDLSLDRPDP